MPLVNVPLIDYTLELLVSAGVERIYVFCVHQADKLLAYLNSSRWMSTAGLQIRPVVSNKARTVGDALRRMHAENVIESDFILVHGDLVGHVKLDEVMRAAASGFALSCVSARLIGGFFSIPGAARAPYAQGERSHDADDDGVHARIAVARVAFTGGRHARGTYR